MKIKKTSEIPPSDAAPARSKKSVEDESKEERRCKPARKINKITIWTITITLMTFLLSAFFSFLTEITTSTAHISVAFLLLLLLVVISIIFDAIGVAATSCEIAPLLSMASRKVKGGKIAIKLVKNAEKVSNICCDVIGDICGIVSGACTLSIVINITINSTDKTNFWISILFSSIVAALTVGGKAIFKGVAVKHSRDIILMVARALSVFEKK